MALSVLEQQLIHITAEYGIPNGGGAAYSDCEMVEEQLIRIAVEDVTPSDETAANQDFDTPSDKTAA